MISPYVCVNVVECIVILKGSSIFKFFFSFLGQNVYTIILKHVITSLIWRIFYLNWERGSRPGCAPRNLEELFHYYYRETNFKKRMHIP